MHFYFVTGSSKGIGLALVKQLLANENNYVIGLSRSNSLSHDRFKHIEVDFTDINKLVTQVKDFFKLPGLSEDVTLINNAGTLGQVGYVGELDAELLPEIYNVNLVAPAVLMNEFLRQLGNSTGNVLIVNISSGAGSYPVDGWSGYCATKAALNMVSEVISKEQQLKEGKVKIFSLAPGVVDTAMQDKIRNISEKQFSGVQKFINLKSNNALSSTENAARKILKILENPNNFKDVLQDVRDF